MKISLALFLLSFVSHAVYSQNEWATWDERYRETELQELISYEETYADSVDKGLIPGSYYVRMDKYRFYVTYTGEKRKIAENVSSSMQRVVKLTLGPEYVSSVKKHKTEYKFILNEKEYWFPVQNVLEKSMNKELRKGDVVLLYCLFLNEHRENGELYLTFLISEFRLQ